MRERDKNTKFCHRVASGRRRRNQIDQIVDDFAVRYKKEENIQRVFVGYFLKLFTTKQNLYIGEAVDVVDQ
ncbi:hypothetical protein ACS0TY_034592 [Phlomoides rotata]